MPDTVSGAAWQQTLQSPVSEGLKSREAAPSKPIRYREASKTLPTGKLWGHRRATLPRNRVLGIFLRN